jgi:hypothetical protein
MSHDDHDDYENLYTRAALDPENDEDDEEEPSQGRRRGRNKTRTRAPGFFIIPAAWVCELGRTEHPATRTVAWSLLERASSQYRGARVYLPVWEAAHNGVSRRARAAALRELEKKGLVTLHHENGAPFSVVLLQMD